jgi:hypothetical protein
LGSSELRRIGYWAAAAKAIGIKLQSEANHRRDIQETIPVQRGGSKAIQWQAFANVTSDPRGRDHPCSTSSTGGELKGHSMDLRVRILHHLNVV